MSFALTSEQQEFQEMLRSFFAETFPSAVLRARAASRAASDAALWRRIEELDLAAGFSGEKKEDRVGFSVLALTAAECGRALVPEGIIESILAGPYLIRSLLSADEQAALRATIGPDAVLALTQGKSRGTVAWSPESLTCDSRKVSAEAAVTPWAECSNVCVLVDPATGKVVVASLEGAERTDVQLLDPTVKASRVKLAGAPGFELSRATAQAVIDSLRALRAAEIAGAMARAVEMTVEFVKTREQFDVPIGGFQAVQHRLADMHVSTEAVSALSRFAAWSSEASPEQFSLSSMAALQQALEYGGAVVEGAIQLHGGIGFTHEYDLHFFLRRVKCLEAVYRMSERELSELVALAGR